MFACVARASNLLRRCWCDYGWQWMVADGGDVAGTTRSSSAATTGSVRARDSACLMGDGEWVLHSFVGRCHSMDQLF